MNRRKLLQQFVTLPALLAVSRLKIAQAVNTPPALEAMAIGPFQPDWNSLEQYRSPQWFADAKFGIWAHWGPQCQPEDGDWYARGMYEEGSEKYQFHLQKYGHPSRVGFKDVCRDWKAENWNPDALMALYKRAGAQYFVALANHHDNFDIFDSKYQEWNATKVGPMRDLMGGWAKAARRQGLRFGVSVHAAHAWNWMEVSQRSDRKGTLAGVPYDGNLRKEDGKGTWWEGLDPQALYAQAHPVSLGKAQGVTGSQWTWGNGATKPDQSYCDKFYNRTLDLINKYDPDLVYFDDTVLPLWPISDVGLKIAAHLYNRSIQTRGKLDVVLNGKGLNEQQRKCMVLDIERGQSNRIEAHPWQTDTCIGKWHYNRKLYTNHLYKSAQTVIHALVDVVSKNGNLLLNIPVRGDGTIDSDELAVVEGIAEWMQGNGESIFGTRPWKVFGEGPAQEAAATASKALNFNESKGKSFGPEDIRFTSKGEVLYAIALGWPEDGKVRIKSLATASPLRPEAIEQVRLCGGASLPFERTAHGLEVTLPATRPAAGAFAYALKIS